ncbi:MAG TPA: hypothetical protein VF761_16740 [Gemmatimonadaceae bacterium]
MTPRRWEARLVNGGRTIVGTRGHYLGHHVGRFPTLGAYVLEAEAEPFWHWTLVWLYAGAFQGSISVAAWPTHSVNALQRVVRPWEFDARPLPPEAHDA